MCRGKLFIIDEVTDVMKDKTTISVTPRVGRNIFTDEHSDDRYILGYCCSSFFFYNPPEIGKKRRGGIPRFITEKHFQLFPENSRSVAGEILCQDNNKTFLEIKLFIIDEVTDVKKDKTSIYVTPRVGGTSLPMSTLMIDLFSAIAALLLF
ncbi:hypothetical protein CEXT_648581 [Caerostris extrusa]|uniref:Uncharacterized protein n=1 Tax=Caerostris extrusa TaxID=172846 RepID=A0AAV4N6E0_CAEEX|nr:hypothetical protein CEXT_648581 [Caerostris extrusa]